jgi:hypothetical protein
MISIRYLFETSKYKPWMKGTPIQVGGPGYPTGDLRLTNAPPGQMLALQKNAEQLTNVQNAEMKKELRRKRNLTPAELASGA